MRKNTITKEGLISFIEANFDELQAGGCARFDLAYSGRAFNSDIVDMSAEDVYACETAISRLLTRHHKNNRHVKEVVEKMKENMKSEVECSCPQPVEIDLRKS